MLPKFRRRGDPGPTADQLRERRLDGIKALSERFLFDLGLLMAGHSSTLEGYVAVPAAQRLRRTIEPFLSTGDAMRPNFGEYGELRVHGDLLALDRPVSAQIDFDDQSVRETSDGELHPSRRRRMRLILTIDAGLQSVEDFSLQLVAPA